MSTLTSTCAKASHLMDLRNIPSCSARLQPAIQHAGVVRELPLPIVMDVLKLDDSLSTARVKEVLVRVHATAVMGAIPKATKAEEHVVPRDRHLTHLFHRCAPKL